MDAQEIRNKLIETKQRFGRGEVGIDELYAAADAYIAAIREYKKRTKNKRLSIPSRAYIIRAI